MSAQILSFPTRTTHRALWIQWLALEYPDKGIRFKEMVEFYDRYPDGMQRMHTESDLKGMVARRKRALVEQARKILAEQGE